MLPILQWFRKRMKILEVQAEQGTGNTQTYNLTLNGNVLYEGTNV